MLHNGADLGCLTHVFSQNNQPTNEKQKNEKDVRRALINTITFSERREKSLGMQQ